MAATFWWWMLAACLAWYSVITVYVAIRGAIDIRNMLARLDELRKQDEQGPTP
jgi:hypothetical protein